MFKIETLDDVKLLKELASFGNDDKIKALENEVSRLNHQNGIFRKTIESQQELIAELKSNLMTPEKCRDIVFDIMSNSSKKDVIVKKGKGKIPIIKSDTSEFHVTDTMAKKFNKILVDGNKLIHHTVRNQKMKLPISVVELLALVEVYQKRDRKLLNKDSERICKLYNINKVQFGKIYYNLKQGVFFNALEEIDRQIRKSQFKIVDENIHLIDGGKTVDTKISKKMFTELVNIYVNSDQPFSTIYKLSKANSKINPIFILMVLRRNTLISKLGV